MADGTFPPGMVPPPAAPVSSQVLERGTLSFLSLPTPTLPLSISDSARLRSAAYASCDPAGRTRAATASLQRATAATNAAAAAAAAAAELQQLRTARLPATVSTGWPPVWLWVPTANAHGLSAAADGNDGFRWISAPRYANGGRGDAGGVQAASAAASSCRAQGARR